jgi:hypothetical protein
MKKSNDSDWTRLSVLSIIIAGILLLFSGIAPILFTNGSSHWNFSETGQIGDTIGGIMNPFIAIGGVIMTFLAFYMQIRANKIQREQFQKTLNKSIVDEKIDCYYKLNLLKLDIEQIQKDIDSRIISTKEYIEREKVNPFKLNLLKRSLLKHYDRIISVDRLSIYKGFKIFLSNDDGWINKFNRLFAILDFLHEAFKKIYDIVDYHNKDIHDDKFTIRNQLVKFEEECIKLINNNTIEQKNIDSNEFLVSALQAYRKEIKDSTIAKEETNLLNIIVILEDLNMNIKNHFNSVEYYLELENLSSLSAQILINMNFLIQKSTQTTSELNSFLNNITGDGDDSITNKLNEIYELINSSLGKIVVEQIQTEYNKAFV